MKIFAHIKTEDRYYEVSCIGSQVELSVETSEAAIDTCTFTPDEARLLGHCLIDIANASEKEEE